MAKKTQGTHLYFIDPEYDSSGAGVRAVGCVNNISGISASRDQIEITCLESTAREYDSGLPNPGAATFGINFDPSDASHIRLHELFVAGTTVEWALGWSDGTAVPTLDSADDFVLASTRSYLTFSGYISDLPFDFALNAVVASSISLQISGFPVLTPKA